MRHWGKTGEREERMRGGREAKEKKKERELEE